MKVFDMITLKSYEISAFYKFVIIDFPGRDGAFDAHAGSMHVHFGWNWRVWNPANIRPKFGRFFRLKRGNSSPWKIDYFWTGCRTSEEGQETGQ